MVTGKIGLAGTPAKTPAQIDAILGLDKGLEGLKAGNAHSQFVIVW
jgi:hypothetical protein